MEEDLERARQDKSAANKLKNWKRFRREKWGNFKRKRVLELRLEESRREIQTLQLRSIEAEDLRKGRLAEIAELDRLRKEQIELKEILAHREDKLQELQEKLVEINEQSFA